MPANPSAKGRVSQAARTMGQHGGAKGGNTRARNLSHAQRVAIAKQGKAAQMRAAKLRGKS